MTDRKDICLWFYALLVLIDMPLNVRKVTLSQ